MRMIQIYEPYWNWEDYQGGMYLMMSASEEQAMTENSAKLLSSPESFRAVARRLASEWPIATALNITNERQNRRAWVGQAACCMNHRATEAATKAAWKILTNEQRAEANGVADEIIADYEQQNRQLHSEVAADGLFG